MASEVKLIRLVTGEELLAVPVGGTQTTYKNIAIVISQGGGNLGIMQYMPYTNMKELTFRDDHIMFTCEPKLELVNEYNKVFGAGLVMATPGDKAKLKLS